MIESWCVSTQILNQIVKDIQCVYIIFPVYSGFTLKPISVSGILLFTNIRQMLSHYSQINDTNGQKDKLS